MASRRCLLRLLSSRLVPQRSQPFAPGSIATRTLTTSSEALGPPAPGALPSPRLYYLSRCHFATRSSGNEDDEYEDEEEHYDEEDSEGEWGDDEEAVAAKKPSGKTEEEKVAEAAEIGYKVLAPLGADEKPFKPYEPVFAIVQVCSIWPVFRYLRLGFGSNA
jgi:large subunit ribosomal protein L21